MRCETTSKSARYVASSIMSHVEPMCKNVMINISVMTCHLPAICFSKERAARLMEWMPTRSGPRPHTEPTPRRLEGKALHGPAVVHWMGMVLRLEGRFCHSTDIA